MTAHRGGTISGHVYGPGEIAVRGVAIYRERTQQLVEPIKKRCYVVIDVETGDYEIDAGDAAAAKDCWAGGPAR